MPIVTICEDQKIEAALKIFLEFKDEHLAALVQKALDRIAEK